MYSRTSNWARRWLFLLLHLESVDHDSQIVKPFIIWSLLNGGVFFYFLVEKFLVLILIRVHIVMEPNNLLVSCQSLNAPCSQALTQINLRTLWPILRQQPESADFGDAFWGVPLLDLNGLHIFSHLHVADVHLLVIGVVSDAILVAIEHLGLEFQRDRRECILIFVYRIFDRFKLYWQRTNVPKAPPVGLSQRPLLFLPRQVPNDGKLANIAHAKRLHNAIVSPKRRLSQLLLLLEVVLQLVRFMSDKLIDGFSHFASLCIVKAGTLEVDGPAIQVAL